MQRQWKQSLAALALLLALGQAPALALTIPVTITDPNINDDDFCSLIEAMDNANSTTTGDVHRDCPIGDPAGADTVDLYLVAGYTHTLTVVNNSTFGPTGLPVVSSPITIEARGRTITRDGSADAFRIFAVAPTGNLTLNETTVSGGLATGSSPGDRGGGVYNDRGAVTLTNSTVSGNSANYGGGVFGGGTTTTLTLTNSIVSGNSAGLGGGVFSLGIMTLTNSTVSGNSAGHGGGGVINNNGGATLTLTNSTVSSNSAGVVGGGVWNNNFGTATLLRTLVSGNTAPTGAEVRNFSATVTADNFNLFGHSGLTNAQAFDGFTPGASDITATSDGTIPTALAAILAPLANNGGPTRTHALVADSPAIDMSPVDADCKPTDQRGVTRPQDGDGDTAPLCDIGAFELEPTTTTTTTLPPTTTTTTLPPTTTTTTLPPTTTTTTLPPSGFTCNGLPVTIVGTNGNNNINGTSGNDVIHGLGGNDTIRGGGGNDTICGGNGNDRLLGEQGLDTLLGQVGVDTLEGGAQNDQLFGAEGNDRLLGGDGNDTLRGGRNNDELLGQSGNDNMNGEQGTDSCNGGSGTDSATNCETTSNVP